MTIRFRNETGSCSCESCESTAGWTGASRRLCLYCYIEGDILPFLGLVIRVKLTTGALFFFFFI